MCERVYVLLDTINHDSETVLATLRGEPGILVDSLEGPHDFMLIIEAPDRRQLAERMVRALSRVEMMTQDLEMLPTQMVEASPIFACHKG